MDLLEFCEASNKLMEPKEGNLPIYNLLAKSTGKNLGLRLASKVCVCRGGEGRQPCRTKALTCGI